ncbi:MAG: hypothetical protein OXB88_05620 [Bacteriovoracales bacterium]|nr:hypothetical protein [Bacteriovoracales bacterium]
MDELPMDFSKLVDETYRLKEKGEGICEVSAPSGISPDDPSSHFPGVLYHIIDQGHTYQIEASAYGEGEKLKTTPNQETLLFQTPSLELAKFVVDSLGNKRFPKTETTFYNIGDPVENWSLLETDHSLKILFRSYGSCEDKDPILLGPLGDSKIASVRFQRFKNNLGNDIFSPKIEVSKKMIIFSRERAQDFAALISFEDFRLLFKKGQISPHLSEKMAAKDFPTLFYYLNELAVMRRFWIQIDRQIKEVL